MSDQSKYDDNSMDSQKVKADNAVTAVLNALLFDEVDGLTNAQLAERLGCSPSTARAWARLAFRVDKGWHRIKPVRMSIEIRERNFNTVSGYREVSGWAIARTYLVSLARRCEGGRD